MHRQEHILVPVPIDTKKQLRMAARNRGVKPDELGRDILLIALNDIGGGRGMVEPMIPMDRIRAAENESKKLREATEELQELFPRLQSAMRKVSDA